MDIILEEMDGYSMPKIFESLETTIVVKKKSKGNKVVFATKEGITPADYINEIEHIGKCGACFSSTLHTSEGVTFLFKDDTGKGITESKKDIYIFWKDGIPLKKTDPKTGTKKINYDKAHYKLTVHVKVEG